MRNTPSDPPPDPTKNDTTFSPEAIAADPRYRRIIQRILRWKGVGPEDIDDIHQDVMVALILRPPSASAVRSAEALIIGICVRMAARHLRRRRERPVMEYEEDTAAAPPSSQQRILRPDTACILKEESEGLAAVLEQMETELRDVLLLVELEEMTWDEAAVVLGVRASKVQSRLRRARAQFDWLSGPVRAGVAPDARGVGRRPMNDDQDDDMTWEPSDWARALIRAARETPPMTEEEEERAVERALRAVALMRQEVSDDGAAGGAAPDAGPVSHR